MDGNQGSRYRRNSHDALLLKLNRSATSVNVDNVDAHPLPYWFELARKGLNKAEAEMGASASDLKAAYTHFTRAAVILDEIIPMHKDFHEFESSYSDIRDKVLPSVTAEVDNLWTLLCYRESASSEDTPPFLRASLRVLDKSIVFLLPSDFRHTTLVFGIKSALSRCCFSSAHVNFDDPIKLTGPTGLIITIRNDEELLEALDQFQDAVDTAETAVRTESYDSELERCPGYTETTSTDPVLTSNCSSLEIPEGFQFRDGVQEGDVIEVELGLW